MIIGNAFERERRAAQATPKRVMWTRDELGDLLNVYGRMVAAGIWRDYAINDGREAAGFPFSAAPANAAVPLINPACDTSKANMCCMPWMAASCAGAMIGSTAAVFRPQSAPPYRLSAFGRRFKTRQ